ncbi:MAG: class II aldolase/adducin family protein [Bdellovibrionaceae bacterium]|nr:class II aldolase/adducin family protein [Pseudobdellovibrionaceae bacterium]NUM60048.1 class II aldolase/adducin family protein [Pseudobdellovibrionaceae bacterium]
MEISSFIKLNQKISSYIPLWTQGAGSNLSLKLDETKMLIKASGFRLDQVDAEQGLVIIDFVKLKKQLQEISTQTPELQESLYSQAISQSQITVSNQDPLKSPVSQLRPSMEAGFHALSKFSLVLHFHSLAAILMGFYYEKKHPKFLEWTTQEKINFIPLVKPGWEISNFFLENDFEINILTHHGLILQANDENVISRWEQKENDFLKTFGFENLLKLKTCFSADGFNHGPLKIYFPDMAIYLERLRPYLIKTSGSLDFSLKMDAPKDLKEIWWASQILFKSQPDLPELSDPLVEEITQLPTEKLRQWYMK